MTITSKAIVTEQAYINVDKAESDQDSCEFFIV